MSESTGRIEMEEWVGILPNSTAAVLRHYIEDGEPKAESVFTPHQEFTDFQAEETSIGSLAKLKGPTRYLFPIAGGMGFDPMVPGMLIQFLRKGSPLFYKDQLFQQISLKETPDNTYTAIFWSDVQPEAEEEQDEDAL